MAKRGRPKKTARERQSKQIAIRVTLAEFGKLKHAAGKSKVSDYIRGKVGLRGESMKNRFQSLSEIRKLQDFLRREPEPMAEKSIEKVATALLLARQQEINAKRAKTRQKKGGKQ